jgi:Uncharacterized protein conserved in bacteria
MQDTFDFSTIIFLCLAVFVIWKLRSVLGQKTGNEQPPEKLTRDNSGQESQRDSWQNQSNNSRPQADNDQVITLPPRQPQEPLKNRWKGIAEDGTPLADTLNRIAALDPSFDAAKFLEGSKMAYEMVVTDFARGDRQQLKELLTAEVYSGFNQAISERETRGEKVETTFVSIDKAELKEAELQSRDARLTVQFLSKLITLTRDKQGNIVDGSAENVTDVIDVWTFARTLGTDDPNWLLAATEGGQ